MKSYYEKERDISGVLIVNKDTRGSYPAHFHQNLELVLAAKGSYELAINGRTEKTEGGAVIVVDSFDVHHQIMIKEDTWGELQNRILIIPYAYLREFNVRREGHSIAEHVVKDADLVMRLIHICDDFLTSEQSEAVKKSAVKLLLNLLYESLSFREKRDNAEAELVRRMLLYIDKNYREDVSRGAIARALGYTEAHISRVFHSYLNMGIPEYVARLRLGHVEIARKSGDQRAIAELIFEAGFNSQQTYYRCLKKTKEQ